jgi:HAE1 family hydrophobic/amphiphilic exporter-1
MKVLGFTLNNMSLMALSLSVGLLIDDAIVVIENIIRHLQQGKSPLQAARDASQEIGLAVTATTFTLVAVFLPVGMMTGEVGQYFKELGITVACSVLVSLLVAFTLVPLLASRYLSSDAKPIGGGLGRFLGSFNHGFTRFGNQYSRLLALSLKHRAKTLAMALTLFAASLFIVPLLGSGFVPSADLGEFNVVAEFDPGIDLDAARQLTADLEQVIRTFPAVEKTYANNDAEQAKIFIKIVPKDERQQSLRELADDMRQELKKVPGVRTTMLFAQGAMIEEKDWEFRMQGQDREVLQSYAEKAVQILESIPGAVDVASSYKPAKPELQLKVKTEQAADLGITAGQIAQTLNTLLSGTVVNKYEEDQDGYDVRLRLEGSQRQNLQDLDNVYLPGAYPTKTGENPQVALSQVTEPVFSTTPSVLNRSDRYKEIIISGNRNGISLGELNRIFLAQAGKEISMQPGYRIYAGGDSERMEDTFSSMITALILAVLFIFFILAAQFESYIDPFSIMLSLPMAAIGAFLGLLATKSDLDLISMIGIIMLMGLVTKNAIC